MSYVEFLDWVSFMRMRGSIDVGQRLDHGFAMIATLIKRATGGKAEMSDFLMTKPQPKHASVEDAFGMLMASAKKSQVAKLAKKG